MSVFWCTVSLTVCTHSTIIRISYIVYRRVCLCLYHIDPSTHSNSISKLHLHRPARCTTMPNLHPHPTALYSRPPTADAPYPPRRSVGMNVEPHLSNPQTFPPRRSRARPPARRMLDIPPSVHPRRSRTQGPRTSVARQLGGAATPSWAHAPPSLTDHPSDSDQTVGSMAACCVSGMGGRGYVVGTGCWIGCGVNRMESFVGDFR